MNKMKQIKLLALLSTTALLLTGCGKTIDPVIEWDPNKTYQVGICQLVQHVALDAATQGFKDKLTEVLGDKVKFDEQNAAGDSATCVTIANNFVSKKVDLIMANATPALQAAANSTVDIPVLGTSITDYGSALNLKNYDGVVGGNVSGTCDLAPLNEQAKMMTDLFPEASKFGILYCSAEANSKYQADNVTKEIKNLKANATVNKYTFADSNDIASTLDKMVGDKVDVLFIPTDNACASNVSIIDSKCSAANLPVFCGEEGICAGCGAFTLSISYYKIGEKTGEMAARIIKEGAHVSKMKVEFDDQPVKKYNPTICERLGITNIPADFEAISQN